MTRARISYADGAARPVHVAGAVDVTTPVAGFYRFRLRSGSVRGGVKIWHGPPLDPVTGEVLDRSWRWQAEFDGEYVEFDQVWPDCTGEPITEQEYQRFVARKRWAEQNAPDSAYADRRKRHDPLSASSPLPF